MKNVIRKFIAVLILINFSYILCAQNKIWTVKACVDEAIAKNVLLNQNLLSSEINKINLEQSKANKYPNLNLSDNQNFTSGRALDPVSYQFLNQNISSNNISLNSSAAIFNGLQNYYTVIQNRYNYDAGNLDIEKAKNDLTLAVVAAYLQILDFYESIEIAKAQVEGSNAQVERTQKFVDAGKVPIGNLYQLQSQLAGDKYSQVNAENQLILAKVALMQLMELPVSYDFEIERPQLAEPDLAVANTSDEIYKTAEQNQPQVVSAGVKISSAYIGLKIARGGIYPKLSLTGSLKTAYSDASRLISYQTGGQVQTIGYLQSNPSDYVVGYVPSTVVQKNEYPLGKQFKNNFNQFIGLSLSVPIFNNYIVKSNIDKAKINLQSVQLDELNTKNQLRKSVEQAYTDQLGASKQYTAAKEQQKAEERTYTDIKIKFENGVVTATDFIIEQNNYNKVKQALIQAKYNYIFKIKVVDFYLGKPLAVL